ncbi:hypothetical protein [Actinomadura sp. B10D3]|uniref:hypothetical protein n=1 Tax=Actinomadura sp. B10D3 TaxID=3153557 RepID=UPI00325D399A
MPSAPKVMTSMARMRRPVTSMVKAIAARSPCEPRMGPSRLSLAPPAMVFV